jgi:thioredoxin-related protein
MNKMKKFVLVFLLALNITTVFSQSQTLFTDKNYDESIAKAKAEKKPLVIFFYAKWCPHCNVMKREVFTDSTVTAFYRKNFVPMSVDAESAYGTELKAKLQNKFKVSSFPTFAFLDSSETLLYCTSGELKKDRVLSEGANVLLPENQLPNLKEAFYSDPSNADKCLKYIAAIKKTGFDATQIAQKYLGTIKPEEKFTEINWRIFSNGISDFDNEEFKFVIQNKDAFSKALTESRVDKKINYTISETLKPLTESVDTINYQKKRLIAESFHTRKIDSLLYRFDIQIVSQTTNWKKYQKIISDNVEKFSWNDTVLLYDICTTYYEVINDKKGLLQAVEWSKHLLTLKESNDNYVVTAKLFLKLKDYKNAAEMAQKGKAFTDNLGLKADEINTLLEQIKKHT